MATADDLIDRRRLRRKVTFWRIAALVIAAVAIVGTAVSINGTAFARRSSDHIAKVRIEGTILEDEKLMERLDDISKSSRVKGVILTIDSPGGTTAGGEAIFNAVRAVAAEKPVVAQVGTLAASAGYMIASASDHIVARQNSIVGSIGVLAQLPNFHRLLEEKGVDFEQVMAGRYKRTLSLFGKNTDEGRDKLQQEVEDIHELFKAQIREHRPQVDVERVATGEHWHGIRALELKLVDELKTSDDFLLEAAKDHDLYHLAYKRRKGWQERVFGGAESLLSR
jgi:protease-4